MLTHILRAALLETAAKQHPSLQKRQQQISIIHSGCSQAAASLLTAVASSFAFILQAPELLATAVATFVTATLAAALITATAAATQNLHTFSDQFLILF